MNSNMNEQQVMVLLTKVAPPHDARGLHPGGALLGHGTLIPTGRAVTFGGDTRLMLWLGEELARSLNHPDHPQTIAVIAPWQIIWVADGDPDLN